jgi:hypothetical protein
MASLSGSKDCETMRRILALTLVLTIYACRISSEGRAEPANESSTTRSGSSGAEFKRPYAGTRDMRTFAAQKQQQMQSYSRASAATPQVDKRSRAAVFAKGVRDYYPAVAPNQSKNHNVIDPRTLCVPGRRALLQR